MDNYNTPFPNGFNSSDFLLDPYTYSYLNATYQRNFEPPVSYEGQYTTDVLKEKSLELLNSATNGKDPFFLTIAPVAPHSNLQTNGPIGPSEDLNSTPPISAERHRHLFKDVKIPRTPNFNPDEVYPPPVYKCNNAMSDTRVKAKRCELDSTPAKTESKQCRLQ